MINRRAPSHPEPSSCPRHTQGEEQADIFSECYSTRIQREVLPPFGPVVLTDRVQPDPSQLVPALRVALLPWGPVPVVPCKAPADVVSLLVHLDRLRSMVPPLGPVVVSDRLQPDPSQSVSAERVAVFPLGPVTLLLWEAELPPLAVVEPLCVTVPP